MLTPTAEAIGITTTIPIEVIYAAGRVPADLNNLFISHPTPQRLIQYAEQNGFPRTCCAWLKGIYGTICEYDIKTVVGVTVGDCSETHVLMEILKSEGRNIIPFAYPGEPDPEACSGAIEDLCHRLGVLPAAAEGKKRELDNVRRVCNRVDRYYADGIEGEGRELFTLLLNSSDFKGDPAAYRVDAERLVEVLSTRPRLDRSIRRIGLLGVPPVFSDLIEVVEARGAKITFFEVPRQFSLPTPGLPLKESYSAFTYPYGVHPRLEDILQAVEERQLRGLIHYVQSFCHRALHDRLLREGIKIPILTLEGDRPGSVDGAILTRIEAFLEMLH